MMRKITKKLTHFIYITILFFCASTMAQNQTDNWQLLTTIDGVEISYKKGNCDVFETLFIKTKNTTSESLTISLKYDFSMDGESIGSGILSINGLAGQTELFSDCITGPKINVFDHLSIFDESTVTLTIIKN